MAGSEDPHRYEDKRVAKDLVKAIDDENNSIAFKILEGDLMEHYKNVRVTLKCNPKDGQGSVIHWTMEYEKRHDEIVDPHTLIEFVTNLQRP
ncbi:hypothetical protein FNV43_RR26710 [Rhamnella rubrinervis]|uniref:Bet v I/Major latex protein domain-containing protein n=1 Tax=Rhamnella rubrinervis TaxID=2594499 RepID=A0A8K0DPU5_9ROSA|nr:hypothetical protein FNV43_RR26710 [Rhamnella rubrinervis]